MNAVQRQESLRRGTGFPGRDMVSEDVRGHLVTFLGEFVGTFAFLFFAFAGAKVSSSFPQYSPHGAMLFTALAFGCSLALNVWVFFRISGGLFNPAVALALALVGAITWTRAGICFIAELFGALTAAGIASGVLPGALHATTDLGGGISVTQGMFLEMFLTAELIFTIFMLAAEKHRATFMAPIGIGTALFVGVLAGGLYTGASLNPVRSFAPAVVDGYFAPHHWIYWVGPLLGALLAVCFYKLIKVLEYEIANPGADDTASIHQTRQRHFEGTDGSADTSFTDISIKAAS